jgi:hypothetical protein
MASEFENCAWGDAGFKATQRGGGLFDRLDDWADGEVEVRLGKNGFASRVRFSASAQVGDLSVVPKLARQEELKRSRGGASGQATVDGWLAWFGRASCPGLDMGLCVGPVWLVNQSFETVLQFRKWWGRATEGGKAEEGERSEARGGWRRRRSHAYPVRCNFPHFSRRINERSVG